MSLTAILFLFIFIFGTALSLSRGPFWGILLYIHVYFNMPSHQFWYYEVPDLRWSITVLVILIASIFLHRDRLSSRKLVDSLIVKEILALLFLVILTSYFSIFPNIAWNTAKKFIGYIVIFLIFIKVVRSFNEMVIILGWILLETSQLSYIAHGRYSGGRLDNVGLPDAGSSNLFGGVLAMVLPLFLPFLFSKNFKIRIISVALAPFVVNAFVMCGSRGAFIGVLASFFTFLYFILFVHGKEINKKLIAILTVIAIGVFFVLLSPDYKERIFSLVDPVDPVKKDISAGRLDTWFYGLKMVSDYPFGAGPSSFLELSPSYIPQELIERNVGKRDAHNTYLLVLVELGYLGLFVYLYMIMTVIAGFRRSWSSVQKCKRSFVYLTDKLINVEYLHISLLSSFLSFIFTIFFAGRFYYEFIYIYLAIIVIYFDLVKKELAQNNKT